jgi:transcriptional regulator with XRE-family HTH domain
MQQAVDDKAVGARLSAIREETGLSQADIAQRLGISLRAYQTYERAERELPFPVALRLFTEFQINPLWLGLGPEAGTQMALSTEGNAELCWSLYEEWEKAISSLTPKLPYEIKKTLHRKLARRTFRDLQVPQEEIAETVRDLKS